MAYRKIDHAEVLEAYRRIGTIKGAQRETGVARTTISGIVRAAGITPKLGAPIQRTDACSRCGKPLGVGKLTYCPACRRKQMHEALRASDRPRLRDKYNRTKLRAESTGIPFSISFDQFYAQWQEQRGLCVYTDEEMLPTGEPGRSARNISVDKIIPSLGYVPGNVVFATNRANTIKHNQTPEELARWMPPWYARVEDRILALQGHEERITT